ncbi:MAG: serine hydrolase domain-containing protein [Candidatus Acidiferrum sp.]
MRRLIVMLYCAGMLFAGVATTFGQSGATVAQAAPYAAAKENAERQAKEWLARGIPGFSVTVAIDGKIVYSEGFGYADLEQRVAAWSTTKFRIGSASKALTSAGMVLLAFGTTRTEKWTTKSTTTMCWVAWSDSKMIPWLLRPALSSAIPAMATTF